MSLSSFILKMLAKKAYKKVAADQKNAIQNQNNALKKIASMGMGSAFLKNLNISKINNYTEFVNTIPVSDYESYKNYIDQISLGERGVLTSEQPNYFAITSGTTSGTKYIPLTKKMWGFQSQAIKELLLLYAYQTNNYKFYNAGMMFIQGSPKLNYLNNLA